MYKRSDIFLYVLEPKLENAERLIVRLARFHEIFDNIMFRIETHHVALAIGQNRFVHVRVFPSVSK